MSESATATSDRSMSDSDDGVAEELADLLGQLTTVADAELRTVPSPRVKVILEPGNQSVPDEVREVLRDFECDVRYPQFDYGDNGDPRLGFTIVVETPEHHVGTRQVRENGPSAVVTISPDALDVSGFELEDRVDLFAREGEVCLREHTGSE